MSKFRLKLRSGTASRRWMGLLATGLTAGLFLWVFRQVSLTELGTILSSAQSSLIGAAILCYLTAFLIRAHRWGIVLGTHYHPGSFRLRSSAVFVGFGCNQILPANIGEFIRAGVMKRFAKIPFGTAVGSIASMRFFDALVAFMLLFTPLLNPSTHLPFSGWPSWLLMSPVLLIGGISGYAAAHPNAIANWIERVLVRVGAPKLATRVSAIIRNLLAGLAVLQSPRRIILTLLDTLALWGISGIAFWLVLLALDIHQPGWQGAFFIQSMESMATILPSLPGHLGTFEAAIRISLDLYNVPTELAVAYILIMRLIVSGSLTIPFAISVVSLGLSFSDFWVRPTRSP